MLNLHASTLAAVVEQAKQDAAQHPRWLNAIARAARELTTNPYLERGEHSSLIIGSPSGRCYSSNGICQCTAYTGLFDGRQVHQGGQACWHRAAARLVRLHDEARAAQQERARKQTKQCPHCCADRAYADRCPAAQISADQAERATKQAAYAQACAALDECFA
jgi:hypothetical protein